MKVIKGGKDKGKTGNKNVQPLHDWEAIENDLLTTTKSIRAISRKHNLSDTSIHRYIKKNGIERDLTQKVKAAVRNKLVRGAVAKQSRVAPSCNPKCNPPKATEKEIIEAAADENISFIHTWDKIFLKTVATATRLKKEIFKRVKVKLPATPEINGKPARRARTITVDKLKPSERATIFNAIVKAETGVFESMRKNLGIGEGENDPLRDSELSNMDDAELRREIEALEASAKKRRA